MKFVAVLFFALIAFAAAQQRRVLYPRPLVFPQYGGDEEYAASLGGAPIGLYRRNDGRGGFGSPLGGGSEVSGISLGGAKVGLYGRDRPSYRLPLLG